jgi:hypothetical protein
MRMNTAYDMIATPMAHEWHMNGSHPWPNALTYHRTPPDDKLHALLPVQCMNGGRHPAPRSSKHDGGGNGNVNHAPPCADNKHCTRCPWYPGWAHAMLCCSSCATWQPGIRPCSYLVLTYPTRAHATWHLLMRQQQAVQQGPRAPRPATCALLWQLAAGPPHGSWPCMCSSYPTWAVLCTMALACSFRKGSRMHFRAILGSAKCEFQHSQCFCPFSDCSLMLTSTLMLEAGSAPDHPSTHPFFGSVCVKSVIIMCSLQEKKDADAHGVVLIPHHASPLDFKTRKPFCS